MKSVALVPFCPLPADSGGKADMWKFLDVLRDLGPCRIVSAARRPVGAGWTPAARAELERLGFEIVLREDAGAPWTIGQWVGMAYGAVAKGLRLERAFPHGNPYHRSAFPAAWWQRVSAGADVALIHYSYWAWLPCTCPKVLALLDLWSDYMWGGTGLETRDIAACRHVFAISLSEVERLRARGVPSVSWCPPAIAPADFPLPGACGLVGSANAFNVEGLRWLESAGADLARAGVRVYGALAGEIRHGGLHTVGRYADNDQPYRENGVVLFTTVQGMGVQIKTIEALACGRAIVARRGAMRGIPPGAGAWLEVDSPAAMVQEAARLGADAAAREELGARARAYYDRHLDRARIRGEIADVLRQAAVARPAAEGA